MLTQTEWAKLNNNPLQSGIVEIWARENPVLNALPFQNIAGSAYRYNVEGSLPGIAFRDFGGAYAESTGVILPTVETLTICGGDSDYDVAHLAMQTGDNDSRAIHDAMKAKALSLTWLKTFFDGDTTANPLEFDGLNKRLTGSQVITAGTNGAALTLDMLDSLIDAVAGEPSILLMSKALRRKVSTLARSTSNLQWQVDDFGRQIAIYAGVPIGVVEDDASGSAILGFDEKAGTSNVTSSIYAVRVGPDALHGIQTAPISVRDLGELDSKPAMRTRTEWYSALVVKHPKAAARLSGVLAG